MIPAELENALRALEWGGETLARQLLVPPSTVRGWRAGRSPVPADVAAWLQRLVAAHEQNPAPARWPARKGD
jgi:hypothetical protein